VAPATRAFEDERGFFNELLELEALALAVVICAAKRGTAGRSRGSADAITGRPVARACFVA